MATLAYAEDPKYHGKTKQIDNRFGYIGDVVIQGEVIL